MPVLQHYYTSYINKQNSNAGFQVKAMSPGIPPDIQSIILRLIAYRIPPTLNEHAIEKHPVALRYYYKGPQECILLCSQSNGKDENGRPGNFFAHTLVMEPDIFTSVPPILYWRSRFWRSQDPDTRTEIRPIPGFDIEPSLDIEQVWDFLAQEGRNEMFYKLMCAVVHSSKKQRRIVIIDSADNVALWIAVVSCMLPPDYRPLLTFATYHHDPYQAQFLITGTTSDSSFRASPEEYLTYFILNAETGKISDVEDSLYAWAAASNASPDKYEEKLLPFFAAGMRRFPNPTHIGGRLDKMRRYFQLLDPQRQQPLTHNDLNCIGVALTEFERLNTYEEDDRDDLKSLWKKLSTALRSQQGTDPDLTKAYTRVVQLLKKLGEFTNLAVLEELQFLTGLLVSEEPSAIGRIQELRQVYSDAEFVEAINHTAFLNRLNQLIQDREDRPLQLVWQQFGPYLQPRQECVGLLQRSLNVLYELWKNERIDQFDLLLDVIKNAMLAQKQDWLCILVDNHTQFPDHIVKYLYYNIVGTIELEERIPYRAIVQPIYSDIILYEVENDIRSAVTRKGGSTIQNGVLKLNQWVKHARQREPDFTPQVIREGLAQLQKTYTPQQWTQLAPEILMNKTLAPLPADVEEELVKIALARITLSRFTPTDVELCKKYQGLPTLSEDTKTTMAGILAMKSGQLDQVLTNQLHIHFKNLTPQAYQVEADRFLAEFFDTGVINKSHSFLVLALNSRKYSNLFWESYWKVVSRILTSPSNAVQVVELLSFWFTVSPSTLRHSYLARFFLDLPLVLEEARKRRGYQEMAREVNMRAAQQSWFASVQDFFSDRKSTLFSLGQNVAQSVAMRLKKPSPGQNRDEQKTNLQSEQEHEYAFETNILKLFENNNIRQSHTQNIPELYTLSRREQFWLAYWAKYASVLASGDAEQALEVLSFWFEDSFHTLEQTPYVVQDFFLGLDQMLSSALKQRGFRETANKIDFIATKQKPEAYPWYPSVQGFLLEEKTGSYSG